MSADPFGGVLFGGVSGCSLVRLKTAVSGVDFEGQFYLKGVFRCSMTQ